jgi:hypothetical protein
MERLRHIEPAHTGPEASLTLLLVALQQQAGSAKQSALAEAAADEFYN